MTTAAFAVYLPTVVRAFAAADYQLTAPMPLGPTGWIWRCSSNPSHTGSVAVTQALHDDGIEWLHASIAFREVDPTYAELALLHRAVFGWQRWSYQVFAPAKDHVSIHDHALHLWGRADGAPVLPNFGAGGSI